MPGLLPNDEQSDIIVIEELREKAQKIIKEIEEQGESTTAEALQRSIIEIDSVRKILAAKIRRNERKERRNERKIKRIERKIQRLQEEMRNCQNCHPSS